MRDTLPTKLIDIPHRMRMCTCMAPASFLPRIFSSEIEMADLVSKSGTISIVWQ